jgi:hypothetical protein
MNIKSTKFRYKKIFAINQVGSTLKGKLLEFHYGLKSENKPEVFCSSDMIYYYDASGEPQNDFVSKIKIGDYIIEYL